VPPVDDARATGANPVVGGPDLLIAAGLAAGSWWARWPGWGAPSLWLDDAWQALVHRADTVGELIQVSATAPGFAATLKTWFVVLGFSEATAQALPLILGIAWPPLLYLVLRWLGLGRSPALLATGIAVMSPIHATYSTRVKQFTTDALLSTALLGGAWAAREGRVRAIDPMAMILVLSIGAIVASGTVAPVAGAVVAFVAWVEWKGGRRRTAVLGLGAFAVAGLAWWWLFLGNQISGSLTRYWQDYYIDLESAGTAVASLGRGVLRLGAGMLPEPLPVWGSVAGLAFMAALVLRRDLAPLLALPLAGAVFLAVLGRAPLGGGRTDVYLYPVLLMGAGAGLDAIVRLAPLAPLAPLARGALVVAALALPLSLPVATPYPIEDVAPLVAIVDAEAAADHGVAVYQLTRYPYALYTANDVSIVDCPACGTGFDPVVDRPGIVGVPTRRAPDEYPPLVSRIAANYRVVWFLASHMVDDIPDIDAAFREVGFREVGRWEREDALLVRYEAAG
jgi:hypothetical protein